MNSESKIPLSVAIIIKNEEANLPRCLESVSFSDQIVVIDSGSTDQSVQIASASGCEVFIESWKGFGPQKQSAIDKCRNKWILLLDSDERLPQKTISIVKQIVLQEEERPVAYSFTRKNFFQGKWIRRMGWWPDRVVRLFCRGSGRMSMAMVHEELIVDCPIVQLETPIEHYTESRLSAILEKINHYSTLGAMEAFEAGKKASVWNAAARASLTFLHDYFLRRGFLEGVQGFTLSITDAVNKFFKYAKLNEMHLKRNSSKRN